MNWDDIRYFEPAEFDSPDNPGSGQHMQMEFVAVLDEVRHACAFPFRITSGFRTPQQNQRCGGAVNSAHLRGYACDIDAQTSRHRFAIVAAAMAHGITRIGVGSRFVHLDNDPSKPNRLIWLY